MRKVKTLKCRKHNHHPPAKIQKVRKTVSSLDVTILLAKRENRISEMITITLLSPFDLPLIPQPFFQLV